MQLKNLWPFFVLKKKFTFWYIIFGLERMASIQLTAIHHGPQSFE